jgi:hypothetical protein
MTSLALAEKGQNLILGNQLMAIYDKEEKKGSDHKSNTLTYRLLP